MLRMDLKVTIKKMHSGKHCINSSTFKSVCIYTMINTSSKFMGHRAWDYNLISVLYLNVLPILI